MKEPRYWIVQRDGSIELRDLSAVDVLHLQQRGYERFIIGRGRFAPIVGFAENAADVGHLRRLLNAQDHPVHPPQKP